MGGSQTNSVLELALGYNGLGRVTGQGESAGGGGGGAHRAASAAAARATSPTSARGFSGWAARRGPQRRPAGCGRRPAAGMFGAGFAGPLRLFTAATGRAVELALPAGPVRAAGRRARRCGASCRWSRAGQALLLWGGWLATYGVVFSMAQGIFHPYYLIMLAPAAAALVGIGVAALWAAYRQGGWQAWLLPLALLVTAHLADDSAGRLPAVEPLAHPAGVRREHARRACRWS